MKSYPQFVVDITTCIDIKRFQVFRRRTVGQTNSRSNRIKRLWQIGEVSHQRVRRFVLGLVLVLILEAFEPHYVSITRTSTTASKIQIPCFGVNMDVSHESGLRLKDCRSDQKRNFWESAPKSAFVGFRIS
ncbi:hypothetical protein D1AOALGA4SA_8157 [Olavius algarvensis Delta 1 endosymbiont]|nr:hypothetical protein D1AOALGA4SA_8157 [Olavius algarvensis Delta 1 endosymbiont]